MKYLAVLDKDPDSDYGVFFPDFPGCVTAGDTPEEAKKLAIEALSGHIECMREDGDFIPAPSSYEEIMEDEDSHALGVFEVDVPEKDPPLKLHITLPESVIHAMSEKGVNPSAFLTQAAREKLHLNTSEKHV